MRVNSYLTLIDKVLPQTVDKSVCRNIKNIQIGYKHAENNFVVNLSVADNENSATKSFFSDSREKFVEKEKTIVLNIERQNFIKLVLKNFVTNPNPIEKSNPQKIVIDFSSPNIAKPFHVGHLRSTIIGNFIANINRYFHNNVTKINYLGDWGTQFGLLQYGLQAKNVDMNDIKDPIKTLYDAYVYANKLSVSDESIQEAARKYFSDIEQGRTGLDNWKQIRNITVLELEKIYQRLGIHFDAYHWESDYNGGAIKDLIDVLEKDGIIKSDQSGKKVTTVGDRDVTVLKSDGSTLYLSRDIAALLDRYNKYKFDKMLYVVDNAQTDHFSAVFNIVRNINKTCADACEHIKFGRIKGMSTRAGNVVFLNDILDEARQKMYEKQKQSKNTKISAVNDQTCDVLGTTAVIINDFKQKRQKDYVFDWERVLQSEGDSGIKLQYLHCRLWSLERSRGITIPEVCEPQHLPEEIVGIVVAELAKFENILQKAKQDHEPHILVNYLFRLARHVNRMFNELRVKDVDEVVAAQRLLVFHCSRQVVKTSLEILGVKPLLEM